MLHDLETCKTCRHSQVRANKDIFCDLLEHLIFIWTDQGIHDTYGYETVTLITDGLKCIKLRHRELDAFLSGENL